MKSRLTSLLLPLLLVIFYIFPASVFAQSVGLAPAHPNFNDKNSYSRFSYTLNPGDQKQDEFAIVNLGDEDQKIIPFVEGGDWVKIASASVTLKPGERKTVPFKIAVPKTAPSGEKQFTITAEDASLPVLITIKGELKKELEVSSVAVSPKDSLLHAKITVRNNGNTIVDSLALKINLANTLPVGGKAEQFTIPFDRKINPGESVALEGDSQKNLPFIGKYTASYILAYDGGSREGLLKNFFYFDLFQVLFYILLFLVVLAIALFLVYRLVEFILRIVKRSRKQEAAIVNKISTVVAQDLQRIDQEKTTTTITLDDNVEYLIRKVVRQELRFFKDEIMDQLSRDKK